MKVLKHVVKRKINVNLVFVGAIALAEFIAESKMLEQLDLRDNDIRIAGLMALSLAHKMNFKLRRLTMPRTIKIEPVCVHVYCIFLFLTIT